MTRTATRNVGLVATLLVATLGEGGGAPDSLVVWHGLVAITWVTVLVRGERGASAVWAPPVATAIGLFAVLFVVGALRAPYAYGALLRTLELAAFAMLLMLAQGAGRALLTRIVWPIRIAATLHGLFMVFQWVLPAVRRPAGTFLNTNHAALWLVMALLVGLGGIGTTETTARQRWIAGLLAVPPTLAVLLTASRGGLVALAAGGVALVLLMSGTVLPYLRRVSRRQWAVVALAGVALIAAAAWLLAERASRHDPFRYHRLQIWRASAQVVLDEPMWGSGPGQFETRAANLRFADGDGPMRFDRSFSTTHSDLLRLPVELGVPAALAFLVGCAITLVSLLRRRSRGDWPPGGDGALAALAAASGHALVDNPSSWSSVCVLAAVLLGALGSSGLPRVGASSAVGRLAAAGLIVGVLIAGDVAPYLAWRTAADLPRGRLSAAQLSELDRAARLNPLHPDYRARRAEHEMSLDAWDPDGYARAREAAEAAIRLHPAEAHYRVTLARTEARACRTLFRDVACRQRAELAYLDAEKRSRYKPSIPLALAVFLVDTGDPSGARRSAERCLALEPEAVLPRLVLADAVLAEGSPSSVERAGRLLAEARDKAERWADYPRDAYSAGLLTLDEAAYRRLQAALETTSLTRPASGP